MQCSMSATVDPSGNVISVADRPNRSAYEAKNWTVTFIDSPSTILLGLGEFRVVDVGYRHPSDECSKLFRRLEYGDGPC